MGTSTLSIDEAGSERSDFFNELDEELQIATKAVVQSHQQLEVMKQQLDAFKNLKNELEQKNNHISSLEMELAQLRESQASSAKATSDAIDALNKLRLEMEIKDEQLHTEREISDLQIQMAKIEMRELAEGKERELKMEVEIATLKSEVHREKYRVAAAEAATATVMCSRAGLYLAVQEFAIEAEKAKAELRMSNELKAASVGENLIIFDEPPEDNEVELLKEKLETANAEIHELREETERFKAEALMLKQLKIVSESGNLFMFDAPLKSNKVELLKEKLETATAEIDEFRTEAETAKAEARMLNELMEATNAEIGELRAETAKAEVRMLNELKVGSEKVIVFDAPQESIEVELLKEKLETATVEIDELRAEAETAKAEARMLNELMAAANAKIGELKAETEKAKAEVKMLNEVKVGSDHVFMVDAPLESREVELLEEKLEAANAEIAELRAEAETAKAEARMLNELMGAANMEIGELRAETKTAKAEVRMLNELKVESENMIMFDAPLESSKVELLEEKLGSANAEIAELRAEAKTAKAEAQMLNELKVATKGENDFTFDILQEGNDVEMLKDKLEAAIKEIDELRAEAETANENVIKFDAPLDNDEVKLLKENLKTANAEIDELRDTLEEVVRRAEKAERDKDEIKEYVRKSRQNREQRRSVSEEHHKKQILSEEHHQQSQSARFEKQQIHFEGHHQQSQSARFEKPPINQSAKRVASLNLQEMSGYNLGKYDQKQQSYVPLYRYLNIKLGKSKA